MRGWNEREGSRVSRRYEKASKYKVKTSKFADYSNPFSRFHRWLNNHNSLRNADLIHWRLFPNFWESPNESPFHAQHGKSSIIILIMFEIQELSHALSAHTHLQCRSRWNILWLFSLVEIIRYRLRGGDMTKTILLLHSMGTRMESNTLNPPDLFQPVDPYANTQFQIMFCNSGRRANLLYYRKYTFIVINRFCITPSRRPLVPHASKPQNDTYYVAGLVVFFFLCCCHCYWVYLSALGHSVCRAPIWNSWHRPYYYAELQFLKLGA